MKHIVIVGLRRSGTTIIWNTLRQHPRRICFDEPFHPELWRGARENSKGTWNELAAFWEEKRIDYVNNLSGIVPENELDAEISSIQKWYFRSLQDQEKPTTIDLVRTWNKIHKLIDDDGNTVVVHLLRNPIGWVTAHMVPPHGISLRRNVMNVYRKKFFFLRRKHFNNWQYEQIIDHIKESADPDLKAIFSSALSNSSMPAYVRLLSFWWGATRLTERNLARLSSTPRLLVTLEEFCANPHYTLQRICKAANDDYKNFDTSSVSHARPGHAPSSWKWKSAFRRAGVPEALGYPSKFNNECVLQLLNEWPGSTK